MHDTTPAAKSLDEDAIRLAVVAHSRLLKVSMMLCWRAVTTAGRRALLWKRRLARRWLTGRQRQEVKISSTQPG